ncbi:MAG: PASTA domain-containing protein, partial [Endomicrobiia bacterium]
SVVDKNTPVDLKISLGLPPQDVILMPDFVNKNISEVKSFAENYGIKLKLNYRLVDPLLQDGIVIEQKPSYDTILNPQDEIEITVSKTTVKEGKLTEEYIKSYNFEYELPFVGKLPKNVKIIQVSDEGEYVLYNKITDPKEKILLYVPPRKNSKLRIFLDGVLIDEK